ncbi:MAG: hypothetical protein AB7F28_08710 [Candidatus Margulisiibacteriota bacterium]
MKNNFVDLNFEKKEGYTQDFVILTPLTPDSETLIIIQFGIN